MAFKFGKNYRLKISDMATTPTFSQVGGEGTLSYKATTDKIDISSKDDGQTKSVASGQSDRMITVNGVSNLPDTGLSNVATAFEAGTAVNVQIIDNTTGTPTNKFAGSCYVFNLSQDFTNNQAAKYSFDLQLAGAPTTNLLFT